MPPGPGFICVKGTSQFQAFASFLPTVPSPVHLPTATQCDSWGPVLMLLYTPTWPLFRAKRPAHRLPCGRAPTSANRRPQLTKAARLKPPWWVVPALGPPNPLNCTIETGELYSA